MIHPLWSYDAVIYELNVRQTTPEGTLSAAAGRLPQLKRLGVDVVWLMPVYPIGEAERKGTLGSYYSVRDYCAVNPEFGTMDDFDAFVKRAHELDMKVLMDWVANHTSRDAKWLSERPSDWYERDADGNPVAPFDWSDTAKLNYANRDVWQGQIDAMTFWLREHSVDGFRCDMAMLVPVEFWQQVRVALQRVRPDVFLLAEAEGPGMFDRAFDACYDWEMYHLMCDVARSARRVWDLRNLIYSDRQRYPSWSMRLSFTSNHDENTWNGTEFERMGDAARAMAALTFLLPQGLPLIYTGQEFGYGRRFPFFEHEPMPVMSENGYTEFYRRLCAMRHSNPALRSADVGGSFIEIDNNAPDCLLTFVRESGDNRVVALMNLSPYKVFTDFHTGTYAGMYVDAMSGGERELYEHEWGDVEPWSFRIYIRR